MVLDISNLAKRASYLKGSSYLCKYGNNTKVARLDKTGTLTIGQPQVEPNVFFAEETTEAHRQEWVSLSPWPWKSKANHPLAAANRKSILKKQENEQPLVLFRYNKLGSGPDGCSEGKT